MAFHAKKSLGQHFLSDARVCRRIVAFAGIEPGDRVIEIGPGTGSLTRFLLDCGACVTAIEIDRELARALRIDTSASHGALTVVEEDVLRIDWQAIVGDAPVKVVGNLPYNIGTRILLKMTGVRNRFHSLSVMLQKEVADRILASPGSSDYGYLTVLMQTHFVVRKGFDVGPGAFRPPPKVVSSVIGLIPAADGPDEAESSALARVVSASFRHRRKTLTNNLRALFGADAVRTALRECGIPDRARPQEVPAAGYRCLVGLL